MEWYFVLIIIFAGAILLLAVGMPVAFAFIIVNMVGVLVLQGGGRGFHTLTLSMFSSVSTFTLLPVPLFVLMGEILWHSQVAFRAIDVLDKLLGRMPGRLSILTVLSGTLFSSLSGSTMANTAVLGTMLLPDMERRGYKRPMSIGPIIASGGLAMMVPPSALAVILAAIAKLSIGKILIAALIPGVIMAVLYLLYIVVRCWLQPSLTPAYEVVRTPWREQLIGGVRYLLPLALIVFLVTGLIVLGVATPTESAALGCLGAFLLAAAYRALNWTVIKKAVEGTVYISVMMLAILVGALGFSQLLAYSGASRGLLEAVIALPIEPIVLIILMQVIVLFLGMFMEQIAIMMITLPIYIPIVKQLGYDPIWFGVLMLVNLEMALTTPPFGLLLFVMKGVAPPDTTMREIYLAGLPFLACDLVAMIVLLVAPESVSWILDLVFSK
ncbi:MAG: TRAP transporter large permease subunit [Proteobacteria bacterium]|nr:TRAP transporter large permease subunit [Pseudomonadota bacterium]